jgi:hypothetical protein
MSNILLTLRTAILDQDEILQAASLKRSEPFRELALMNNISKFILITGGLFFTKRFFWREVLCFRDTNLAPICSASWRVKSRVAVVFPSALERFVSLSIS